MEPASKTYLLDQNEVKLSKAGGRLLIEIEAKSSQRTFSIELNNDTVIQASEGSFTDVEAMYSGLEEALNKVYKEVMISFDGNGKLTYCATFSIGSFKKDHKFSIYLQEKSLNPLIVLERKVDALNEELEKLRISQQSNHQGEKNGAQQDKMIVEMMNKLEKRIFEKFDEMEKKFEELETKFAGLQQAKPSEKTELPAIFSSSGSNFCFKNNHRTAELVSKDYGELLVAKSLPKSGKLTFTFKLEGYYNFGRRLQIGIAPVDKMETSRWTGSGIYYGVPAGSIHVSGGVTMSKRPGQPSYGEGGDTLSMTTDFSRGVISFEINNFEVNSTAVDMKNEPYFAFISIEGQSNRITFLNATHTN